jgi:hypothetical protein
MSVDVTRRLTRLREVLPSVYDTRPGDSLLGTVLLRVAQELAGMDEAQRRVLHDRWLPLAFGTASSGGGLPALDRLGALLDTPRLATAGATEDTEAYRARLAITAGALTGGLATPRALLSLALAAVGTETCPKLRTRLAERRRAEDPWVVEATEARGMPPGTRRRCADCRRPDAACPLAERDAVAEAYLVENPVTPMKLPVEAAYWQPFPIESQSLTTDRPAIRLRPLGALALSNPAVQNCATGEIVLFQGFVRSGETLVLLPVMADEELRPFDSIDADAHHPWARGRRSGRAVLQGATGERDVSAAIFFMSGSRFDDLETVYSGPAGDPPDPAELGTRFAVMAQAVRTPRLRPGTDPWRLLQFARSGSVFWSGPDEGPPAGHETEEPAVFADAAAVEGTRFALLDTTGHETGVEQARLLFDSLKQAEEAAAKAEPDRPIAALEIEWLVRPPATVRLCLRRSAQVEAAQALGAIDLLLRDLDLARPAGVRTLFEIRERPLPQEALTPAEGAVRLQAAGNWREDATPAERPVAIDVRAGLPAERHPVGDGRPVWAGRFDGTTFDGSRLI